MPPTTRALQVQIVIQGNHQNGRDTHVRQVRVYGFLSRAAAAAAATMVATSSEQEHQVDLVSSNHTSSLEQNVEYSMFAGIR